jgi:Predicted dehydrogenases and related proteins
MALPVNPYTAPKGPVKISDGSEYLPVNKPGPVVEKGEFIFAAIGLDHGHITAMTKELIAAGGVCKLVYDPDSNKVEKFLKAFPDVKAAASEEEVLSDKEVKMVAAACITSKRADLGLRVMSAGKDYFTDKAPLTSMEQLQAVRQKVKETGLKYMCYFGERVHSESANFAGYLIESGAIGRVVQVLGLGPHYLLPDGRPDWFFQREYFGGILCDIGSHQIEQFMFFSGNEDATVARSNIANFAHPQYPTFEDYGDAMLIGENGATNYFRVDWFNPNSAINVKGGGQILLGTKGFIDRRSHFDPQTGKSVGELFMANDKGEIGFEIAGKVGFPFFGELILDVLNRTENAMTQTHMLKAAELSVQAQLQAVKIADAVREG